MVKHGYVEGRQRLSRHGQGEHSPDLQKKLQRQIDMVAETAKRLADVGALVGSYSLNRTGRQR